MRTIPLLFLILLNSLYFYAQDWNTDSLSWHVKTTFGDYQSSGRNFLGETVPINDTLYRAYYGINCAGEIKEPFLKGYIRQIGDSIFCREIESNHERLLYDFSLEEGDVFNLSIFDMESEIIFTDYTATLTVQSVEYIEINGVLKKQINLFYETWIEDVGSLNGPTQFTQNYFITDIGNLLLCMHSDGEEVYSDENHETCCFFNTGVKEINPKKGLGLYPNPLRKGDELHFREVDSYSEVKIHTLTGKLVESLNIEPNTPLPTATLKLEAGTYIIAVINEQEKQFDLLQVM